MKRSLVAAGAAVVLAVSVAAPAGAESDNADPTACFGQDRADFAVAQPPGGVGDAASYARGDNADQNAAYRERCQP